MTFSVGLARSDSLLADLAATPDRLAGFLFEQPGIGQVAIDPAGGIVRANVAARELAGPGANMSIGAPAKALFAETARDAATAEIAACLRGHTMRPLFASVLRGGAIVSVTALAIRDRDGPVCGVMLRLMDLSAQRQLETQLAQAQKLQAMGQFAGGIAHDFNNLLTAILGAAETAANHPGMPVEAAEDVAQIRMSAGRGAALVRQLLAFGRPQPLQPRVLRLSDVVAEMSGLLRRLLGSQIRLDLELAQPGGRARVDSTQLEQVLLNLAANARDAMPDGGALTVRTGHVTLHRIQTRGAETMPPGRYVSLEVEDTGTGIAPDVLPRIFDPFFTTRHGSGGTGLGLSTVHGIVRQSGGFLEVRSVVGQGTRIRIRLPNADDLAVGMPEPPSVARASGSGRESSGRWGASSAIRPLLGTVLVVDDEQPVRRLAERALARAGWRVISAAGGAEALALLAEQDAPGGWLAGLITDMAMDGMNGVRLVGEVRARVGRPLLPALLVSGYSEASLRGALAGQRGVVFLAKPYELRELVDAFAAISGVIQPVFTNAREQTDLSVAFSQVTNI